MFFVILILFVCYQIFENRYWNIKKNLILNINQYFPNRFKLGTFNLHALISTPKRNRNVNLLAKLISVLDLDLIVFQECWTGSAAFELSKYFPKYSVFSPWQISQMSRSGLLILSKYQIYFDQFISFNANKKFEFLVKKGILKCYFQTHSGQMVNIFVTHFPDLKDNSHFLKILITAINQKNEKQIIVGDFNMDVNKICSVIQKKCDALFEKTFNQDSLDAIFVKNLRIIKTNFIDTNGLSDHRGIVSEIE